MLLGEFLESIESCDSVICINGYHLHHWQPSDIEVMIRDEDPILSDPVKTFHATDAYQITVVLQ